MITSITGLSHGFKDLGQRFQSISFSPREKAGMRGNGAFQLDG